MYLGVKNTNLHIIFSRQRKGLAYSQTANFKMAASSSKTNRHWKTLNSQPLSPMIITNYKQKIKLNWFKAAIKSRRNVTFGKYGNLELWLWETNLILSVGNYGTILFPTIYKAGATTAPLLAVKRNLWRYWFLISALEHDRLLDLCVLIYF